jgi:hypothetical protein
MATIITTQLYVYPVTIPARHVSMPYLVKPATWQSAIASRTVLPYFVIALINTTTQAYLYANYAITPV